MQEYNSQKNEFLSEIFVWNEIPAYKKTEFHGFRFETMMRRELYTKSKTAEREAEREEARKAYLDKVGMHRDFRW